jgi:hypothetical protein
MMGKLSYLQAQLGQKKEEDKKTCAGCGIEKPLSDFWFTKRRTKSPRGEAKDYPDKYCIECSSKQRDDLAQNEKVYKIFYDGYCEITLKKGNIDVDRRSGEALLSDHDHITGEHRGMLGKNPNTALGHFGESIENVFNAWVYLLKQQLNNLIRTDQPRSYDSFEHYWDELSVLMDTDYKNRKKDTKKHLKFLWDNEQGINHARYNKLPL